MTTLYAETMLSACYVSCNDIGWLTMTMLLLIVVIAADMILVTDAGVEEKWFRTLVGVEHFGQLFPTRASHPFKI